ncbi:MAG: hypothetical protein EOO39_00730 [Cytophagaceae bacterium]|nr:MAG: hypothetical protein EOO39_00730 [Cytophagaceae bacterium]
MSPKQAIDKNLEQYAFGVAAKFIDRFDEASQANMIKLLYRLNIPNPSIDHVGESVERVSNHSNTDTEDDQTASFTRHKGERSTTVYTSKLITPAQKFAAERLARLQRSLTMDQDNIDSTTRSIARMDTLIRLAQKNTTQSHLTDQILLHYQLIRSNFVNRLINIQVMHQQAKWKLAALTHPD